MKREGNAWKITIPFYEGDYRYAFSVNGYTWLKDPDNPQTAKTPYGNECSLFKVGQETLASKRTGKDGRTVPQGLYHDQTSAYLSINEHVLSVRFRVQKISGTKAVLVLRKPKEGTEELEMHKAWEDTYFEYYECDAHMSEYPAEYFFKAENGENVAFFSTAGASADMDAVVSFVIDESLSAVFDVPSWAMGAVFYEIFTDRFYNGDRETDPQNIAKWGSKPTTRNFFGGDIKGIIDKLDYLQSLGVEAIYLTPIFWSKSNHKYDTLDYFKIDPHFDTSRELKQLVTEAHSRGIRVILDAVFNHTSDEFWAFEDVLRKQQRSKYAIWYFPIKFPVKRPRLVKAMLNIRLPRRVRHWLMSAFPLRYETFAGVSHMPKVNMLNPETADYFTRVAEYWIQEADIDGWRFDVAFGIPYSFWKELRARLKKLKPDIYLLGEFGNGNPDPSAWVGQEAFDAVMNYPLRTIIIDFVVLERLHVTEFYQKLAELMGKLPKRALHVMYNLLGSHDTPRLMTICQRDIKKAKLAVFLQMTLPGAPAIYYGDEVGMQGENDPDCRRTMSWIADEWNMELLKYYKQLIKARKEHASLTLGNFTPLMMDHVKNVFAFQTKYKKELSVIIVNNSFEALEISFKDNRQFKEILTEAAYKPVKGFIKVNVPPKQGVLLVATSM